MRRKVLKSDVSEADRLLQEIRELHEKNVATTRKVLESVENALPGLWNLTVEFYSEVEDKNGPSLWPRERRFRTIMNEEVLPKMILEYARKHPAPDFTNPNQRSEIEAFLGLEEPLNHVYLEACKCWRAGNFEGEAAVLEEFARSSSHSSELLDLAAEARREGRNQPIRHVVVDLNELLKDLASKGLALPFKCPSCGASIRIDINSSVEKLKSCEYCGTAIDTNTLTSFLKNLL